jgi:hypothetical protein
MFESIGALLASPFPKNCRGDIGAVFYSNLDQNPKTSSKIIK